MLLLVGDSHLARLGDSVPQLGPRVVNRAVGGSFSTDLAEQVAGLDLTAYDVVVVSTGTNDLAPWKQVPRVTFERAVADFLARVPCPTVLVAPPGVVEARMSRARDRTNALVRDYTDSAAEVVRLGGGEVLDSAGVLAPLGADAFVADGVHLSPAGYELLLSALAERIEHADGRGPRDAQRPATLG